MKLKMDKSSYKSAENYLGKGEKKQQTNTGRNHKVLRQWDDVKSIQIPSQGINNHAHVGDGAEGQQLNCKQRDFDAMGRGYSKTTKSSRILEKNAAAYFPHWKYVSGQTKLRLLDITMNDIQVRKIAVIRTYF